MSRRHTPILLFLSALAGMAGGLFVTPGCTGNGLLGLEDYQRDLVFGYLAAALLQNQDGGDPPAGAPVPGADGADGLNCWDLNGNGQGDEAEDVNGDGQYTSLDCQGSPGSAGADGAPGTQGPEGSPGSTGPRGAPGPSFFTVFVDDFFGNAGTAALPVVVVAVEEPILGYYEVASKYAPTIAYRVAIPATHHVGDDVTMRLFFYRTGPYYGECLIFRLDAVRLRQGSGVETYGRPVFISIDVSEVFENGEPAGDNIDDGLLWRIDLPINTAAGLGFSNPLSAGDFLAFELRTWVFDGGIYEILGAEFFSSAAGTARTQAACIIEVEEKKEPQCCCVGEGPDCNENGRPDDCDIETGVSGDCNENGVPDECDIALGQAGRGGPVIIGGDDADDHGDFTEGGNEEGWLYIQDAFNLIGPQVANGNRLAVCLGCNTIVLPEDEDGELFELLRAFQSGFDQSGGPAAGWTRQVLTGSTAISNFFNNVGAVTLEDAGIIYMPSHSEAEDEFGEEIIARITDEEMAVINANASALNRFVAEGGGLFVHDQSRTEGGFGWLATLLPGLEFNDADETACDDGTLELTAAGSASFPSLTDEIVSNATPWHSWFSGNLGGLQVLVTGPCKTSNGDEPVIIGGAQVRISGSLDCNDNGIPDECEVCGPGATAVPACLQDCNNNRLLDVCEISVESEAPGGPFYCTEACDPDENANGIPDSCEEICVCHEDVEVVCHYGDLGSTASLGVYVNYDLPTVDEACYFTCVGDGKVVHAAGRAQVGQVGGLGCSSVHCSPPQASYFPLGDNEVHCTSYQGLPTGGDVVVDECTFTIHVLPITHACAGTFTGTFYVGDGSGTIQAQVFADGSVRITFVGPPWFGEVTATGTVSECGYVNATNPEFFGLSVTGNLYTGKGCYGSGIFIYKGGSGSWIMSLDPQD